MKQILLDAHKHAQNWLGQGTPATFIPELTKQNPDQLGIAITTCDGQRLCIGDCTEKFTMQRIYNVTIEKISEGRGENGDPQLVYMLDFMINKNNGSLRNDMDSDSSKPWYLSIVNVDGNYLIDNIITYNQK